MTGMTVVGAAPLRAEPSHRSEMITQLLFGELATLGEVEGDFVKAICQYDGYEGWCQRKQLTVLQGATYPYLTRIVAHIADRVVVNGAPIELSPGSVGFVPDSLSPLAVGAYQLVFHYAPSQPTSFNTQRDAVMHYARMFLGTPYLWGGRSRFGIDCSGFTQVVYKLAGIFLPRDSGPQSKQGEVVNFLQEAQPGDLAFFDNDEGRIVHVGILIDPQKIIHASASVRIDPIDNHGILHAQEGDRTHKLRLIKRYLPE